MRKGTVKWFSEEQGFGFIETSEQKDVFIHFSATQKSGYRTLTEDSLGEGSEVVFDIAEGTDGPKAINIRREPPTEKESVD